MDDKKNQKKILYGTSKRTQKKIRRELFDQDYLDKLSPKELKWLNKFNMEFNQADFSSRGDDLHKTKEAKKICYDRNNSRNRDIFARSKAYQKLVSFEDLREKEKNPEDGIIESIDSTTRHEED